MRKTLAEITKNMDMVLFNDCPTVDPEIFDSVEA